MALGDINKCPCASKAIIEADLCGESSLQAALDAILERTFYEHWRVIGDDEPAASVVGPPGPDMLLLDLAMASLRSFFSILRSSIPVMCSFGSSETGKVF